jgi:hypothetical protein
LRLWNEDGLLVSLADRRRHIADRLVCLRQVASCKPARNSEQKARDQIIKDRATYAAADKKQCMRTDVYLPSYVEWLTCLEMERDVRKMQREDQFGAGPYTLPKVSPALVPKFSARNMAWASCPW